jgi:hypothetical protein
VRSDLIPPNRALTVALIVGIIALVVYGVYRGDPVTIVIVAALALVFALPAFLLFTANRRARRDAPPQESDESDESDEAQYPPSDV